MNTIGYPPLIRLNVYINNRQLLGNYTCLCDTGSTISCINASDRLTSLCVEPSKSNPLGANGLKLETLGDINGQIQIGNQMYDIRLTIIPNLCYTIIIGIDILNKLGFHIDGTKLVIAGTEISRVFETGYNNITTSISSTPVNAKILSITQMSECDEHQGYQQRDAKGSVIDQHCKGTANLPTQMSLDVTDNTNISTVEHNRMYQKTEPKSGYEPTMLKTATENKSATEKLGCFCSYMATEEPTTPVPTLIEDVR